MKELIDIFQALGNNVRFKVLKLLFIEKRKNPKGGGLCVCKLIDACGIAGSTMTHHLDWLRSVGLLTSEKRGQWVYYDVDIAKIKEFKNMVREEL